MATNLSTQRLVEYFIAKRPKLVNALDGLTALLQVHPDYIGEAFVTIEGSYGSVDCNLQRSLNMGLEKREKLLDILC